MQIEKSGQIIIDETFPVTAPISVRIIVLFPESEDFGENEWLQAAAKSEAFDFLNDSEEDIYSLADGKPLER